MRKIPVAGPWITEKEVQAVAEATRTAWYERAAEPIQKFERLFCELTGTRFAIALPSCTSALHLSLAGLGIGPGDEVIVPEITWIATAAPIQYVGATPVFADIDRRSWCLSADSVQKLITDRTKAIIAVDLYGGMPDYRRLRELCEEWDIDLIEDAAQAAGATFDGRPAGSLGKVGVFSFHGSKTLTTGEGGMLVTDDEALYQRALFLRDHGRPPGDRLFLNTEVAFKYRMSGIAAALGAAQTERLPELLERKRFIFSEYASRLSGIPGLTLNPSLPQVQNAYWMVTPALDPAWGLGKFDLMERLLEKGIQTRPFFAPLSSLDAYRGKPCAAGAELRNKVAYSISPWAINLPSALTLTRDDIEYVCEEFVKLLPGVRRANESVTLLG